MHSFKLRSLSRSANARVAWLLVFLLVSQVLVFAQGPASAQPAAATQQDILPYIKNAWNTLGRSMNECSSISDPKFGAGATSVIYLPFGVTPPPAVAALSKCGVNVENRPKKVTGLGTIPVDQLNAHGLLYLPNKYVVPGGRVNEILVAKTDLSYGYTQPVREGQFYNLYHGFMEARPVTKTTSKLIYTLMLDESDKADKAAKDADLAQRRTRFEAALQKMKQIAEGTVAPAK